MKNLFLAFIILVLISCKPLSNIDTKHNLQGKWYLNKWLPYNFLNFSDSTVFVENSIDTVFTLNYSISNDILITWLGSSKKYRHQIIKLTDCELILDGIHDQEGKLIYTRTNEIK